MYFEIDPKSKLGKRAQSIANYYRNLTGAKGRISRKIKSATDTRMSLRVTVSKNNMLGLSYVGLLMNGRTISLSIEYGKLECSTYTFGTGLVECSETTVKRLLKKLFQSEFSHIPPNVEIETVMRVA